MLALLGESGFFDALDAESFAHGLVVGHDPFGGAVGVEAEHGFEAAPATRDGVGTLGAKNTILPVEAVAVGTCILKDGVDEGIDRALSGRRSDVLERRISEKADRALKVVRIRVDHDRATRPLAPKRDVRPGITCADGRQMMCEAPVGWEVAMGRGRLATDAPPIVQEPERER